MRGFGIIILCTLLSSLAYAGAWHDKWRYERVQPKYNISPQQLLLMRPFEVLPPGGCQDSDDTADNPFAIKGSIKWMTYKKKQILPEGGGIIINSPKLHSAADYCKDSGTPWLFEYTCNKYDPSKLHPQVFEVVQCSLGMLCQDGRCVEDISCIDEDYDPTNSKAQYFVASSVQYAAPGYPTIQIDDECLGSGSVLEEQVCVATIQGKHWEPQFIDCSQFIQDGICLDNQCAPPNGCDIYAKTLSPTIDSDNDGDPDIFDPCPADPQNLCLPLNVGPACGVTAEYVKEKEEECLNNGGHIDCELDTDGDGLYDWREDTNDNCSYDNQYDVSNWLIPDSDCDGIIDGYEIYCFGSSSITLGFLSTPCVEAGGGAKPWLEWDAQVCINKSIDYDGDGLPDYYELNFSMTDPKSVNGGDVVSESIDSDNDGLGDVIEAAITFTDINNADTDGDGLIDGCLLDPNTGSAILGQGELCQQILNGNFSANNLFADCGNMPYVACDTNPLNPDTDGDGLFDGAERMYPSNPRHIDTDGDCIIDGLEDANLNGLFDSSETNVDDIDTDKDGLPDGRIGGIGEDRNCNGVLNWWETNPRDANTDGDSKNDYNDLCPLNPDPYCCP